MNLQQHLNDFYVQYNIPENGGEDDKTFEVPLPFFKLILPNFSWRKKMLHVHDLEHILNQQDTTWKGEIFIASWEIATGFWKYFPVCIFPLWTMGWGLWKHPSSVLKGFRKGSADRGIANLEIPKYQLLTMDFEQLCELTEHKAMPKSRLFSKLKLISLILISQLVFLSPFIFSLLLLSLLF